MTNNMPYNQKPPQQKMSKLKLVLIILAFVVVFGGQIVACSSLSNTVVRSVNSFTVNNSFNFDYDDLFGNDTSSSSGIDISENNSEFRQYFDLSNSKDAISTSDLTNLKSTYYSNQGKTDSTYSAGIYEVGKDIDPGVYYIYGQDKQINTFFVLNKKESADTYDVGVVNTYYGHNLVNLTSGQIIVVDNDKGFLLKSDSQITYTSPYKSGVYEVGKDIPAGKYTLSAGSANDYYAYFIMKDLDYTDDSVTDGQAAYNISDSVSIQLEEGTYVELYNITAKSTSGTGSAFA